MTTKTETTWVRYRHKKNPKIEYDVETMVGRPLIHVTPFGGEEYRIRTVRNLFYREEIHIPGFTYMPADKFLGLYERV